jgi:protein phosphatase
MTTLSMETWRPLRAILLLPGMAAVVVPGLLLYLGGLDTFGMWRSNPASALAFLALGAILVGWGLVLLAVTVRHFATTGRGTLAPWDPPRRLVVEGVYGHVRNPMIVGVALVLLGEAVATASLPLLCWFALFAAVNLAYIPLVEEPGLARRFGEAYEAYARAVPRWIPRLKAWEGKDGQGRSAVTPPQEAKPDSQRNGTVPSFDHPKPPPVVQSFGLTDPGRVRSSNEDCFLVAELARTLWARQTSLPQPETQHGRNRGHIFLVADGMGGHQAGEVASALTVATIESFVLHVLRRFSNLQATDEQTVLKDLQAAIREADARIAEEAAHHQELAGMGTTVTLALASGWRLFVIHAGDSRCYLFRRGQLRQLTHDHTLAADMARQGIIKAEQVGHHQWRHVVTNVLGGDTGGVQVDVQKVDLEAEGVVLLCSDGLTDMLADERMAAILAAEREPKAACERLVTEANGAGGQDNITAIVARFDAV